MISGALSYKERCSPTEAFNLRLTRASESAVLPAAEADSAYENVDIVVDAGNKVGIAAKGARFVPSTVVKG